MQPGRPGSAHTSKAGLDEIVSAVSSSKKYRTICADTVRRIAERELMHRGDLKAAVKATKGRLHQVYGAFEDALDTERAYAWLAEAYGSGSQGQIEAACRRVMGRHRSTRERLPILDRFYPALFALTGRPRSILDMGCGLNPLALPWMELADGARYIALDIDAERVRFLNRFLALAGCEPLARCQDLLVQQPSDAADVTLLLKTSPTLDRQEAGGTERVLDGLNTPFAVVSFAVKSLGGREKGMEAQYQQQFLEMVTRRGWPVEKLPFETELAFVVELPGRRHAASGADDGGSH